MINSINSNVLLPLGTSTKSKQEPALSITVTPDSNNVSSGDRSANLVTVNIATPKNEVDTTVTREQAVNKLEARLLKNTLNNAIGNPKSGPGPVKSLLIKDAISNSDLDSGDVRKTAVDLYSTKLAYDTAQFALDTFNNNPPPETPTYSSPSSSSESENQFVALSNQATDYYIKSTLFFSATDKIGQTIDKFS